MQSSLNIHVLIDEIAEKVAVRLRPDLESMGVGSSSVRPRLLTVEQAATYLGRSKASVQHLVSNGAVPTVRHDRRVFFDREDLDTWIERNKQ